jgi:hypothetical protein
VLDNRFVFGVQGITSTGLDQQGVVDVNASRTAQFILANEGGRPVYAEPSAIVASTGSIAAGAGRVSSEFQRVLMQRSDLRTQSRQLTVNLKPVTANPRLKWEANYTLLDVREQFYGFSSTAGDPFAIDWGPSTQATRHSAGVRWNDLPIFDLVYVTMVVQALSGERFTPMIASDVNGDGIPCGHRSQATSSTSPSDIVRVRRTRDTCPPVSAPSTTC